MTANFHLRSLPLRILGVSFLWAAAAALCIAGMPLRASAATPPSGTIDIMFVIDNSGSMRKNDPEFITPKVVSAFIRRLPLEAMVGMVVFDQTARLVKPLTPVITDEALAAFIAGLDQIDYRGQFTNSAAGIERALYELKTKSRQDAQKGIVFITDGIVDTGDAKRDQELNQWLKQDLTVESRALGVHIFGIAFSEAADFVLIQALSARTGGQYYRTYEASSISPVLDDILTHLSPKMPEPQQEAGAPATPAPPDEGGAPAESYTQPAPAPATQTQPRQPVSPPADGGGIQLLFVILAFAVTVLAAVLIVLYIRQMNVFRKSVPIIPAPATLPPDAYLEEWPQGQGTGLPPMEIKKERTTIGRDRRNDIVIERPTISSFHATIEYRNMLFFVEDQRSTNGTRLNDKRLEPNMPIRLKNGDHISFATFQFKFVIPNQIPFGETAMISVTALEEESGSTVVIDLEDAESGHGLINCIQSHLLQLHAMGPKYREFISRYFAFGTLEIIAAKAHECLIKTESDGALHCEPVHQDNVYYLVCSLPVPISNAADWYGANHNGFTQFLMKWIRSETYISSKSDMLCVVTFGQDPATWVSLTIVPTREEEDPVEIMSVDFLNEAEKAMLALDFDHHGRVT